ncbi:PAS domain-containing protein [Rubrivirga sp.]|uniref:sensor histidine kinase n=1 Tax=Rubrivirga sp. TaxID=1885344 RepID=UPI003C7764E4
MTPPTGRREHPEPRDDRHLNADLDGDTIKRALHAANNLVVITDPKQDDNPIVWVNDFFCHFTGYDRDEVIGRNCRFLQGDDRDQAERYELRDSVDDARSTHVLIRNYKKDGTIFYNDLYVSPVPMEDQPRYYIGVQNDVSARINAIIKAEDHEREVQETAENERERFGMDLHDGLGQTLAGATMLSHALHKDLEAFANPDGPLGAMPEELLKKLRTLSEHSKSLHGHIERTVGEARDMAYGLNPVDASATGLADALNRLAEQAQTDDGPEFIVNAEDIAFKDRRQARHLYRIAQEAVSNAVKHAQAKTIRITLHQTHQGTALEVMDDGVGVERENRLREAGDLGLSGGRGLASIRYRADLIGARVDISPSLRGGTQVSVLLPTSPEDAPRNQRHAE